MTVIVIDCEVPEQPFAEGVTEIVPEMFEVVVFVAVNEGILPVPFAANPMFVFVLDQAYVVPDTLKVLAKLIALVD